MIEGHFTADEFARAVQKVAQHIWDTYIQPCWLQRNLERPASVLLRALKATPVSHHAHLRSPPHLPGG